MYHLCRLQVRRIATGGTARGPLAREAGSVVLVRGKGAGAGSIGIDVVGPREEHNTSVPHGAGSMEGESSSSARDDGSACMRSGVFVADVSPESPAAAHAWIVPGLRLLRVNGRDVTNATQRECVELLERGDSVEVCANGFVLLCARS